MVETLDEGWLVQLRRRKNGEPYPDPDNVETALKSLEPLKGLLRYNEFSDQIEIMRPIPGRPRDSLNELFEDDDPQALADEHITQLTIYLARVAGFCGLRETVVQQTVRVVAKEHPVHPLRGYLEGCYSLWDQKPRIDTWLKRYLGAKDNEAYLTDVGAKFLIGAIARVVRPGCQMDSILVLEGEQGEGKSRTVRALGQQWSADLSGNLADKDAAISLQRVWIAELAELTALRRSEQEPIKGFLTRTQDYYRPPYGRNNVMRPRHTVFIATTNERDYLLDPTGARRYWPVDCGSIDLKALEADVTQLWGEAMSRYGDREPWHLDKIQSARAVEEQAARQRTTPADQLVLEYADRLKAAGETKIEMRLLLQEAFDCDPKEDPMKASGLASNAARALVREGWKRLKPTGRGASRKQVYEWVTNIVTPDASQGSQGSQGISGENDDDIPF